MSFFSTKEKAFGLDISDKTLRLIQLTQRGKKIKIQNFNEIALPIECIVDGKIKKVQPFIESLKKLTKTSIGSGTISNEVVAVLPEAETFLKTLYIRANDEMVLPDKIKEELPLHLPLDIEEIYFDWQIVEKKDEIYTIILGASPKKIVDSYIEAISSAGFTPVVLEIESAAISHLLIEFNQDCQTQIIIDIGANRTGLFLYDRGLIKFTISLPISGKQLDQTIAESLDLEISKAEEAKIAFGLDPNKINGALLEILNPTIEELIQQIDLAMDFYHDNFNDTQPIEKIILCGGGANFIGIQEILSKKLKIKVFKSEPFKLLNNPNPNFFNEKRIQSFITAIGLAIRGLNPKSFYDHN